MSRSIQIDGRNIGPGERPYVVAELSANHNGSLDTACEIIAAIAATGADAVKLQTYTADTLTLDHDGPGFKLESGPWAGRTLYDLYEEAHTPWDWHEKLFATARSLGLSVFSSPFDASAVDFLETFDPPAYKIASFELVDLGLIEYVAARKRPMILSTGMADASEVEAAVATARRGGCNDLVLLHCTSAYPAPHDQADLAMIAALAERHDTLVGLSDHSLAPEVAIAAAALGACVIEKHVTLRRADGGPDAAFSLEPDELAALVHSTAIAAEARGQVRSEPRDAEAAQRPLRRSLYVVEDVPAGARFDSNNVRSIRPGLGLPPANLAQVLGRRAAVDVARGTPLAWKLIADGD